MPRIAGADRWVRHLPTRQWGVDRTTFDSDAPPYLPPEWRRSAESMAHSLGVSLPAQASDAEWAAILQNVEEAARMRGVSEMPSRWQEALAHNVGRT